MEDNIDSEIAAIAADNRSGAAEILARAANVFSLLAAAGTAGKSRPRRTVLEVCDALTHAQPAMAPVINLTTCVRAAIEGASAHDSPEVLPAALKAAQEFIARTARAIEAAAAHGAALIPEGACVLTHSRSSTVALAFTTAARAGRRFSVIGTESRPRLEGRTLAEALAREGVPVSLVADAAAVLMIERVDLALIGADRITPAGLVNKIGTRMIALAAAERGCPLFAICDASKFLKTEPAPGRVPDEHGAGEIWDEAPVGVTILNPYFETTPLSYFTKIITEAGALSAEEIARQITLAQR